MFYRANQFKFGNEKRLKMYMMDIYVRVLLLAISVRYTGIPSLPLDQSKPSSWTRHNM